jgi:hypothetical protein
VVFHNIDQKEGEGLLKKVLPRGVWDSGAAPSDEANRYPAIVIDSKTVKITSSIQMVTGSLLGDYRSELTEALIGIAAGDIAAAIGDAAGEPPSQGAPVVRTASAEGEARHG